MLSFEVALSSQFFHLCILLIIALMKDVKSAFNLFPPLSILHFTCDTLTNAEAVYEGRKYISVNIL